MAARICTEFATPADVVWHKLKMPETLRTITRRMIAFSGSERWPDRFEAGVAIDTRMWFFHIIPAWSYHMEVVACDDASHVIRSHEYGGPLKRWDHRIVVTPIGETRCGYTDEIDIDGGILTFFIWLYAHLFYRYRQARWKMVVLRGDTGSTLA